MDQEQHTQQNEQELSKKERRELRRGERRDREQSDRTKRSSLKWIKWLIVLAVLGLVVWGVAAANSGSKDLVGPGEVIGALTLTDEEWEKGNSEAAVVLVEYSDLQCPACRQYYPMVRELAEQLGDDVRVVYRHFPLRQIHTNAQLAAQATEAAGMQGTFWEMHDKLFEEQSRWSNMSGRGAEDTFVSYAEELGLDPERFKDDMNSRDAKQAVNNDYATGLAATVNSTPTFFLNGSRIANPRSYESLRATVQREIDLVAQRDGSTETSSVE